MFCFCRDRDTTPNNVGVWNEGGGGINRSVIGFERDRPRQKKGRRNVRDSIMNLRVRARWLMMLQAAAGNVLDPNSSSISNSYG